MTETAAAALVSKFISVWELPESRVPIRCLSRLTRIASDSFATIDVALIGPDGRMADIRSMVLSGADVSTDDLVDFLGEVSQMWCRAVRLSAAGALRCVGLPRWADLGLDVDISREAP